MKNFIQPGDVIEVTAPGSVSSGDGVLVGVLFGIATTDAGSGDDVQIKTTGVFDLPKPTNQAWNTVGAIVYWDDAQNRCTTTDNNVPVGAVVATAAEAAAVGRVRLTGQVSGTAMVGT